MRRLSRHFSALALVAVAACEPCCLLEVGRHVVIEGSEPVAEKRILAERTAAVFSRSRLRALVATKFPELSEKQLERISVYPIEMEMIPTQGKPYTEVHLVASVKYEQGFTKGDEIAVFLKPLVSNELVRQTALLAASRHKSPPN